MTNSKTWHICRYCRYCTDLKLNFNAHKITNKNDLAVKKHYKF